MNEALFIAPISALVGVFVGAWLTHRSHARLSPIPDMAIGIKSIIAVFRKPAPTKKFSVPMPTMKA